MAQHAPFRASIALSFASMLAATAAAAQVPPPPCGDVVTVQRGDTLSRIAERCDVSERSLIRLNPQIQGSGDLRVGMEIRAREGSGSGDPLDRLGALAGEAAEALSGVARDLGSSAQELLDRNPDLRSRLERFGQRFGSSPAPAPDGRVEVAPREGVAGDTVTVSARGLPRETPVVLGAGRPQAAYEVIERARTGPEGTLQTSVRIPDWAEAGDRLVIVVAGEDRNWTVRSAPVRITGSKL